MPYLSRTEVIGHVAGDPEIRYTAGGDAVANVAVAYNEKWKDKSGADQERAEFFRCVAFGATADKFIGPYVKSGDLVRVVGKMWTRKWQDKDGGDRYSVELKLDRFEGIMILKSKDGERHATAQGGAPQQRPQPQPQQAQGGAAEDFSDDIPF